ncbi:Abnormal spindle-like microcephaly-assoc'd, ASPM-SPD-2-Hydin [Bryocella elongata]|uniref:Abnormal spindle-like microcephaly-assoc'd, ASPM-SPD-2-Hydin n=1 Tax=Bryocella elongata TaxID=863522 RepID=A0A1H5XRU8_9BACT|nr:choice-of-anchor D domain-containing protein [Bryocella elongata]SEG14383.1 Abnormal spindle-like microcephaly-assoc'd, ASPM-SPD-2-Hydin [Bryocella elongata]
MATARSARPDSSILTAPWQPLGPGSLASLSYGNVTGRVTALALDLNDATGNTVYLGTTGGGVWKSANAASALGSVTFAPLTDDLPAFSANSGSAVIPSLSIGALAVQPHTNPVLLAGTGDPNDAIDSLYGEGLLRSTDGGLTWAVIQGSHDGVNGNHSFIGLATAGIAFSTASPSLVVAAFSTSADGILTGESSTSTAGLYYSSDAGLTWQMASLYDGAQVVQQPTPYFGSQPGNPVTSMVWDAQRALFVAAVRYHGYYSSPDGMTWTRLASQPGAGLALANCPSITTSTACPIFRGALAVQPATGDLYALTVDASSNDQGLWQDLCRLNAGACSTPQPAFATRIDNGSLEAGSGNTTIAQGTYNLALSAAPASSGETALYAGTIDLYRCTLALNGTSCTWRNTTNAVNGCAAPAQVAPAQHALATLSQSSGNPLLFLGNDSGLWRSLDGVAETGAACSASDASHFDNLNAAIGAGGSLAEIVGLAQHPSDADTLLAGLGQNGSGATSTVSSLAAWPQLSAGEGGFPLLDPNTPSNWLLSIGAGVNVALCQLGPACAPANFVPPATVGEAQVSYDAAQLDAPALLDPGMTTSLVTATCRVWRGPAGSGSSWSTSNALSPAFDGGATPCTPSSALVRSIALGGPVSSSSSAQWAGSQVIYAGISGSLDGGAAIGGHVFVTTTANAATSTSAWTDVTGSPVTNDSAGFNPAGFDVSALAVDPHDATGAIIYATIMGFGEPHLYRSTDFGAHWTNISANLPNAPANAVAVDPNDANTVYVALDTGVYVTSSVTTCPTTNCWSPLGTGLPNSPVTSLAAGASLPTGDGRVGLLRAGTYGRGIWSTPLLTAAPPVAAAITVSPASLTFPATGVGNTSAAQTLTVTSSGNTTLVIGTLSVTGNFAIPASAPDTCSGHSLAAGTSCTVGVVFVPVVLGSASGTLSIPSSAGSGTVVVPLSATGVHPATDALTPTSLTFASQPVNTTSAAQTVTLTNAGDLALAISSITSSSADFGETDTCGTLLAAQSSCSINVAFTPSASGTRTATLTLTDAIRSQTVSLSGTGFNPATDTLSPVSLTFASQAVNTSSAAQLATITNSGDVALSLSSISSTSTEFPQTNACGSSIAPHTACSVSVVFAPTVTGTRTGSLIIVDAIQTETVALSGSSAAPPTDTLAPASLTFPSQLVNTTSTAQTVMLTNSGDLALAIASIAASPSPYTLVNHCGASLAAHSSCALSVTFTPAVRGSISGSLTVTDALHTQSVALSGTGSLPATDTLSATSLAFVSQTIGTTSSPRNITLTNSGDLPLPITSITSSSLDFPQTNNCGSSLPALTSCSITVSFSPTTTGARTGSIALVDANGTQSVALTGQGTAPAGVSVAPASLGFGAVLTGTTATAQVITLTNNGGTIVNVSSATASAGFNVASSTCGATLSVGSACTFSITFTPPAGGAFNGTFTLVDDAPSSPQIVALSGTGATPAALTLSATALSFPSTVVGSTSATENLILSNPGGLPLTLAGINVSAGFTLASSNCGSTLAAGSSCTVSVAFTPLVGGALTGTLTVGNSATPAIQTVTLSGTGLAAATDTLSPLSLTFAAQSTGISSVAQLATLTNSGDVALSLTGVSSSNPNFAVADGCGPSLAAHSSCSYRISFSSSTTGTSTGVLTVADTLRTQVVALTGSTYLPATDNLSATAITFAIEPVGTTSSPQNLVLTNTGDVALSIQSITTSSAEFGATGNCGASLAAHSSCTLNVTFTPSGSGTRTGSLVITDALRTQTVSLGGTGEQAATDTLSATALTFPSQQVSTTSPAQTVTLSNTGDVNLSISSITSASPDFAAVSSCGASVAAHSSCTLSITFTPSATGNRSGLITLVDSAHTETISLTGVAVAPANLVFTPSSLSFPATLVNQTSATLIVTLSNTGGNAATLQAPVITGDFAITSNTCGSSLQPSSGCSLAITFTPVATGTRSGMLTVATSAGSQTAVLNGTGNAPATDTLTPLALTFSLQQIGTTSAGQQVTLTNAGDVPLTLIATSTSTTEFGAVNACGPSLAAHSTCAVVVTFTPTATGARSGILTISDSYRTQTVVLTGTGAAPPGVSLSPASLTFAPTGVGAASATQAVVLTNNGGLPLNIANTSISPGFALASNSCNAVLIVGANCVLQINSTPAAPGSYSGSLTLTTNGVPATQTVALAGAGVDFTLVATGATSQTVNTGGTASYALQLASTASLSGPVALSCTGAPTNSHCLASPATGALGGTQVISVTVTTGVAALERGPAPPWMQRRTEIAFALSMPLLWLGRRRRRLVSLACMMLVSIGLASLSGCGAGRALPPGATTTLPYPTPAGTYTLTITGSASGISHTVLLTLIVQ